MPPTTLEHLTDRLELAEQLRLGRERMFAPQDLPGRYGRVVHAIDRVLQAVGCESVVADGWAVWRHGYVGRVTQDIDIVLPADRVEEFLRAASVAGFEVLQVPAGRRPKVVHKETGVTVDILPEGGRPGTPARLAPTTIPHPARLGAAGSTLRYSTLPALLELKVAAGRVRDESDIVELIRANPEQIATIRQHLSGVHKDYVQAFDQLVQRAQSEPEA
jgi:hypothetical protein